MCFDHVNVWGNLESLKILIIEDEIVENPTQIWIANLFGFG